MSKSKEEIKNSILSSKKYRHINPATVDRMINELSTKYDEKHLEKKSKEKMHQLWGAYFTRPDFEKLKRKLNEVVESDGDLDQFTNELLMLQTSTSERRGFIEAFYKEIFALMPNADKVVDLGCGANPLSYRWMGDVQYIGYDVDIELSEFCNYYFKKCGFQKAESKVGDIFDLKIASTDVVMLLKVVMLLERQKSGVVPELLKNMETKYFVISYPTKTLTEKNIGMIDSYKRQFDLIEKEMRFGKVDELVFENELVFVCRTS